MFENKKYIFSFAMFVFFLYFLFANNIVYASQTILDPGHSPNNPGALSCTGVQEYKYNDELVNYVAKEFESQKIDYTITRKPTQHFSLLDRTKATNDAKIFISIHHDSVQPQFISYLDGNPTSTKAEGYSIFVSRKNKQYNQSVEYARNLAKNLYSMGLRPSKHHGEKIKGENRYALDEDLGIYIFDDLVVLKKSQCPAILLEAGVIVNPVDEKKVGSEEFKTSISKAIMNTINTSLSEK